MQYIRFAIIVTSLLSALLWYLYGKKSGHWTYAILAIIWLMSVAIFFVVRLVLIMPALTLNSISIGLYMVGIAICGGVAAGKLKAIRGTRE